MAEDEDEEDERKPAAVVHGDSNMDEDENKQRFACPAAPGRFQRRREGCYETS